MTDAVATKTQAKPQAMTREVTLTRTFDAPRALVWSAWTEPKHMAQWWGRTTSPIRCARWTCGRAAN